jgi:predicted permease
VPERNVSSEYLRTLKAKLLGGRYFTEAEDDPSKPGVVLVSQAFAKKFFPGEDPIGRHISFEGAHDSMEIVGMVDDIKEGQLDTVNQATIYVPFSQGWFRSFCVVVRTSQADQAFLETLTTGIHQIDRGIATSDVATMNEVINDSQSSYLHRSSAWLVGGFASVALLLSVVGLYGVIAYSVSQRTREIGVRMALGAERGNVYSMVMREASQLIAVGLVAGLAASVGAALAMRKLLFGVKAWDVQTLLCVALVLACAALVASFLPARRAALVSPADALRAE